MSDEMKNISSGIKNLFKHKIKTEHHVHVHHHVKQPDCPNVRKGGILSDQYKNLPRRKHKKVLKIFIIGESRNTIRFS